MDVRVLRKGDINCQHPYILYSFSLEWQSGLCDVCGRYSITEPVVFGSPRGGSWLPPNALVRTTLPFFSYETYTHKTNERGFLDGPLPEEAWVRLRDARAGI